MAILGRLFIPKNLSHFGLIGILLSVVSAAQAFARAECSVAGKYINLDNGDNTKDLTGTVICRDDNTKVAQREEKYVKGVVVFIRYFYDNGKVKSECGRSSQGNSQGLCKEWDEKGQLSSERNYIDGRLKGLSKWYFPNGKVERIAAHIDDYKKTEMKFNEDGSLAQMECSTAAISAKDREMCGYKGKKGVVRLYVNKSQPYLEHTFFNGEVVASKKIDVETGNVTETSKKAETGKNGVTVEKFPNGKTKQEKRYDSDGVLNGLQKEFAESGQLTRDALFNKGFMAREKIFYLNGQVKRLTKKTKQDMKVFVLAKEYHDNGQLKREGTYLEVTETRHFSWGSYWRYEDLKEQGKFQEWREDGTLAVEEKYIDGRREGLSRWFYGNGKQVEREYSYENDRLVREKTYDKTGRLTAHDEYFADGSKKSHMKKKGK